MEFAKIKAYKFIDFLNKHCRFVAPGVASVVFKSNSMYEAVDIADGQYMIHIPIADYRAYDYFITLQKPVVVTKNEKNRIKFNIPYHLIPFQSTNFKSDNIVTKEIDKILTIGDFISLFFPAPNDVTFKIVVNGKSRDYKCLGADHDKVMELGIKNIEFLKTCIRINT